MGNASAVHATQKGIFSLLNGGGLPHSATVHGGRVKDSVVTPFVWIEPPSGITGDRTSSGRAQFLPFMIHVYSDSDSPEICYAVTSAILELLDPTAATLMGLDAPFVHYGHDVPVEDYEMGESPEGGPRHHGQILFTPWVSG